MNLFTQLPEVHAHEERLASSAWCMETRAPGPRRDRAVCLVGAQVGVASFVIRFAEFTAPGTPDKVAANYLKLHCSIHDWKIRRILGDEVHSSLSNARIFACGALASVAFALLGSGAVAVGGVVAAGFFHSIMFPTIFALSIKNLGALTKTGSSLLVMRLSEARCSRR